MIHISSIKTLDKASRKFLNRYKHEQKTIKNPQVITIMDTMTVNLNLKYCSTSPDLSTEFYLVKLDIDGDSLVKWMNKINTKCKTVDKFPSMENFKKK